MRSYNARDLAGGILLAFLGAYVLYTSFDFGIGTATRMGPGFLPMVLGICLIVFGALIALPVFHMPSALPPVAWRPFLAVIMGMLGFYLALESLGLVPAVWVLVGIAAIADRRMTVLPALGLMAAVSAAAWLLFILALRLPMTAFEGLS